MSTFALLLFSLSTITALCSSVKTKPNIVLVITDDQDYVLGGTIPMEKTRKLIADHGVTFLNSFAAAPICCPSRSSILTGMYPHNHLTVNNTVSGGCSSDKWQKILELNTFGAILNRDAKYTTFYSGKYLNQYGEKEANGPEHVPSGWDTWRGLIGNSKYYNFTLSKDGLPKVYDNGEYLTDVIRDQTLHFIDKQFESNFLKPMLIVAAPPAPHAPFTAAPRHESEFSDVEALKTPNFNIPPTDKHWLMRNPATPIPEDALPTLDLIYRKRWQSLLAVDEMVEAIVQRLEKYNILDNTYVIFTSDNGYHVGQFAQPFDKRQPYETDIRIPLFIRGPGIDKGFKSEYPNVNVDLAPTILKIAGLEQPDHMDGIPLPIFSDKSNTNLESSISTNELFTIEEYDRQILVEYQGEGSNVTNPECPHTEHLFDCLPKFGCKCQDSRNNTFSCLRHLHPVINFAYCSFEDSEQFEEAYDLKEDVHQQRNVVENIMPSIKFKYQNTLAHLKQCKGSNCNTYVFH